MGRNKVTPPFPALPSFGVCCIVLGYYQPTMTCFVMLRMLSKSTQKLAKSKHRKLIKGGTSRSVVSVRRCYMLRETVTNEAALNR